MLEMLPPIIGARYDAPLGIHWSLLVAYTLMKSVVVE